MDRPLSLAQLLTLPCEDAAHLASDALDRDLEFPERFAVRLHEVYCLGCRRYRKQLGFLRDASRKLLAGDAETAALPAEAKEKIREALRRADDPS